MNTDNKAVYSVFIKTLYVPVYSQPWWLDAVCGSEHWDVWIYYSGQDVLAAMPYYFEDRGPYKYITKAPLTQTNGIIFKHYEGSKIQKRAEFEEKVINAMYEWLENSAFDVYEQQYSHTFNNWQPFFWQGFSCITRYSYLISDTSDMESIVSGYSSNLRKNLKKGVQATKKIISISPEDFYSEHSKVYEKQGLVCPFSRELWMKLYNACDEHDCGKILASLNADDKISSLAYFIWDDQYLYFIMGGSMPEYSNENTFCYLMHTGIKMASERGLAFDFEGSMIKRVAKAMREYGGIPTPYYRIRKLFNPAIIQMEADNGIKKVNEAK